MKHKHSLKIKNKIKINLTERKGKIIYELPWLIFFQFLVKFHSFTIQFFFKFSNLKHPNFTDFYYYAMNAIIAHGILKDLLLLWKENVDCKCIFATRCL